MALDWTHVIIILSQHMAAYKLVIGSPRLECFAFNFLPDYSKISLKTFAILGNFPVINKLKLSGNKLNANHCFGTPKNNYG